MKRLKSKIKLNNYDVLVVVDMQVAFNSAYSKNVIRGCKKAIRLFKEQELGIVVLEYSGSGRTIPQITNTIGNYLHKSKKVKTEDDGSSVLDGNGYINSAKDNRGTIYLCGVNADCCVKDTARGLNELGYTTKILRNACNYREDRMYYGGRTMGEHFREQGVRVLEI